MNLYVLMPGLFGCEPLDQIPFVLKIIELFYESFIKIGFYGEI